MERQDQNLRTGDRTAEVRPKPTKIRGSRLVMYGHWLCIDSDQKHAMAAAAKITSEKDERISLRVNARVKATIHEGAALAGIDQTAFIDAAAQKAAIEQIKAQQRMELTAVDAAAFLAALDNPPPPTARALAAFERYRKDTVSL